MNRRWIHGAALAAVLAASCACSETSRGGERQAGAPASAEAPATAPAAPVVDVAARTAAVPVPAVQADAAGGVEERWFDTPEELARAALAALEAKDVDALQALRVTERRYKEELCPAFIAKKPRHTVPIEFHWRMLAAGNAKGLAELLADHGGRQLELVEVCRDRLEEYGTFRLWRDVTLAVREANDRRGEIHALRSFVERAGRFALLSYVED